MTGANLVDMFRQMPIDYAGNNYRWDDYLVLAWFNEAEREAAIRARLLFDATTESVCSVTVASGTATAAISDKILEIDRALLDGKQLAKISRTELDRVDPDWRTAAGTPTCLIHENLSIVVNRAVEADTDIALEVYRLPLVDFTLATSPEIAPAHHNELLGWVCYRALTSEDFEELEGMQQRGEKHLAKFERYFGRKPNAGLRKRWRSDLPHRNKCW